MAAGCTRFISDEDVIATAKTRNTTRAIESMRKAHRLGLIDGAVIAVGNAPTALLEVLRLVREDGVRPALVIGVPVGFVSAAESKEAASTSSAVPFIVVAGAQGREPDRRRDHPRALDAFGRPSEAGQHEQASGGHGRSASATTGARA